MTVVVTGAAGRIGMTLCDRLPSLGWTVRALDREPVPGGVRGDITCPDDLDRAFAGAEAVVHLAGVPTEAPWRHLLASNIDGLVQVFEAARRAGIRRVVYASSNHAVGFTPVTPGLGPDAAPRPDTLYGVTKAFGEALGRYYADRYGLQVACVRIGTFDDRPRDRRTLPTWLSPDDCARLVDACLRAPQLTYALVWGISANTRRTYDLGAALALGYRPGDDSEAYAAELPVPDAHPSDAFVGGGFTDAGFGIDEVLSRS